MLDEGRRGLKMSNGHVSFLSVHCLFLPICLSLGVPLLGREGCANELDEH